MVGPYVSWMIVAGNDNESWTNVLSRAFGFSEEGVAVCPYFEMVYENVVAFIEVLEKDGWLICVAAPPFVSVLEVSVWMVLTCLTRFAGPGIAEIP